MAPPEILNTDQGSPFTSVAFLTALQDAKIAMSLDGTGAWRDTVFVERLWQTLTDEAVYLRAYRSVSEARRGLDRYVAFDNQRRPHSSLGGQTRPIRPLSPSQRHARRRHTQRGDPRIDRSQPVQNR